MAESSLDHKKDAFNYDVFLSFYGDDTRHGFTGNLYSALCNRGIRTFFDKEDLQSVIEIPIREALEKAIIESRIAIPIMSTNYAFSSFCLEELETIMKEKTSSILPIFYNVEPSDVRHKRGTYEEGLAKHENNPKVPKQTISNWRETLYQLAELPGRHFKNGYDYEYEFIGKIVNDVSKKINRRLVRVAKHPVGLNSRIQQVKELLEDVPSCEGARMIGITGQGGLGKTTLALAIYNFIADDFDASCFLRDVKDKAKGNDGLLGLQKDLLSKLLGQKEFDFISPEEGIVQLEDRLRLKKVLIILDDVDKLKQLEFTIGDPNWFHTGSTIIITTRNKQLLKNAKVESIYEMEELNKEDACQLLMLNALKPKEMADSSFLDVFNRVAKYCSGLPLALELIGSSLYGKPIDIWESAVSQLAERRTLNNEIFDTLKLSYDNLQYDLERRVFLDIACCFKGYSLEGLKIILHARYGYSMEYTIDVLIHRCLIKIIQDGDYEVEEVTLHDLIEDMGKKIVQQESEKEPGKRSRLWCHKEIVQVLRQNTGSEHIEIIMLEFFFWRKKGVEWNEDAFEKMKNLEVLIIKNGNFLKGPTHLPNSLKVLQWHKYASKELPSDFCPENLVLCSLSDGFYAPKRLTSISSSKSSKYTSMRILHLDECPQLKCIPDVSSFSNLEDLSFSGCKNLNVIDKSVGFLKNLKTLNAMRCKNLKSFPPLKLPALENLWLSYCSKLKRFPDILAEMGKITELEIKETSIVTFSSSFVKLTGLQRLRMHKVNFRGRWDGASVFQLNVIMSMPHLIEFSAIGMDGWELPQGGSYSSNIKSISLEDCNVTDDFLEALTTWFPYLEELSLEEEMLIKTIPECFQEILSLKKLRLIYCPNLECIQGIPPNFEFLDIRAVPKLTPSNINKLLMNQEVILKAGNTMLNFPGIEIPSWFEHISKETSTSFWFRNNWPQLVICVTPLFSISKYIRSSGLELNINGTKYVIWDHVYIGEIYILGMNKLRVECNLEGKYVKNEWNHAQVICSNSNGDIWVNLFGIHVLDQESDMEDIRFTDPFRERDQEVAPDRVMVTQISEMQIVQQEQPRKFKEVVCLDFKDTPSTSSLAIQGGFHVLEEGSSNMHQNNIQIMDEPENSGLHNLGFVDAAVSARQTMEQHHQKGFFFRIWNSACGCLDFFVLLKRDIN